ncbi:MAG: hypothetical protein WAU88_03960 [Candidatus Zixiibacteriota bacterium]
MSMRILMCAIILGAALAASVAGKVPDSCRVIHAFVALADNDHQGIIPVPKRLGDGTDPQNNLYWGAAYGVKTYFRRSPDWTLLTTTVGVRPDTVLERCVFKHKRLGLYLVADAYKGERIQQAVEDFLRLAAGRQLGDTVSVRETGGTTSLSVSNAELAVYVGHEGLMDFALPMQGLSGDSTGRQTIILACMSRQYFVKHLRGLKAEPVLWTTGLMAPEAYTLHAAIDAWGGGKGTDVIRTEAAAAYDKFQHCGITAAKRLLVTGY